MLGHGRVINREGDDWRGLKEARRDVEDDWAFSRGTGGDEKILQAEGSPCSKAGGGDEIACALGGLQASLPG